MMSIHLFVSFSPDSFVMSQVYWTEHGMEVLTGHIRMEQHQICVVLGFILLLWCKFEIRSSQEVTRQVKQWAVFLFTWDEWESTGGEDVPWWKRETLTHCPDYTDPPLGFVFPSPPDPGSCSLWFIFWSILLSLNNRLWGPDGSKTVTPSREQGVVNLTPSQRNWTIWGSQTGN